MDDLIGLILIVIGVALGLWLLFSIIHIVREYERLVVFLFGRLQGARGPGIVLLIPFVEALFTPASAGALPGGGPGAGDGADLMARFLDATVYRLVDVGGDPLDAIQGIILLILAVFLLKNAFDFLRAYLVARVEQGVTRDLRNRVYDHLLELDLAFFGRTRMGQIVSRLTHDVEQLRTLVTKELSKLMSSGFEFLVAVAFMLAISWQLTLAAFVVIPGTMGVWGPLVKRLRRGDRRVLDLAGEVNAHIQETLAGIRLVKSAGAERFERGRFHGLTGDYFRTFVRTERLRALAAPLTEMLAAVGTVVILWYGARLVVVEGALTGAQFVGFLALSLKLYAPVKYAAKFPAIVQPGLVGAERVFEFLDAPIEIRDRRGARPFQGVERELRFEGVGFAYRPDEPVLQDVDLAVPAGTVVALVGPSGAGKTTLVDLLGRFYDPTEGRITVDGTDLRDLSIDSLRQALGIVSQETVLFHDTVRANIAYGMADASHEEVERAARAANAHEFVSAMPRGYETVVGERGAQLSGGQRQRLAIARAILRDPPILVFDEATSALDTESERLVQSAVERLLRGRTVFVIAHRLSTVQRADQIVVLERGRIVERGTHADLLSRGGLYRRLHELQFDDPPEAAVPSS
ncbi:MAG: ATP-binding cassette domain-containing protein [Gemmatimonadetes bacterium]|nr:ATP-binding cassette domain-containing protein [Gemmatimonadota bacterium]